MNWTDVDFIKENPIRLGLRIVTWVIEGDPHEGGRCTVYFILKPMLLGGFIKTS